MVRVGEGGEGGEKRKLLHTPAFERGQQKTQLFVIGEERLDGCRMGQCVV